MIFFCTQEVKNEIGACQQKAIANSTNALMISASQTQSVSEINNCKSIKRSYSQAFETQNPLCALNAQIPPLTSCVMQSNCKRSKDAPAGLSTFGHWNCNKNHHQNLFDLKKSMSTQYISTFCLQFFMQIHKSQTFLFSLFKRKRCFIKHLLNWHFFNLRHLCSRSKKKPMFI